MQNEEKRVPRSWIGEQVLLARTTGADSELVNLREVNDTGLVYAYETGELAEVPIFVPWASVSWIRPSVPKDSEATE